MAFPTDMTAGNPKGIYEDEGESHFVNALKCFLLSARKRPIRCLLKSPSPGL